MAKAYILTNSEHSTVTMALIAWKTRCEAEAKQMDEWAADYRGKGDNVIADKCDRNAIASRQFIVDTDAALAKLKRGY